MADQADFIDIGTDMNNPQGEIGRTEPVEQTDAFTKLTQARPWSQAQLETFHHTWMGYLKDINIGRPTGVPSEHQDGGLINLDWTHPSVADLNEIVRNRAEIYHAHEVPLDIDKRTDLVNAIFQAKVESHTRFAAFAAELVTYRASRALSVGLNISSDQRGSTLGAFLRSAIDLLVAHGRTDMGPECP